MGIIHQSFDQVLSRIAAADKTTDCDLRGFMMAHMNELFLECPVQQLESFRDTLAECEAYEWCADLQQLINTNTGQA